MNILLIGCGKIGYYLTERLTNEKHNVTVIDSDESVVSRVNDTLDAMAIHGNGACMTTLRDAGAAESDVAIAVTGSDEVNMLSCFLAKSAGAKHTIARIRDAEYMRDLAALRDALKLDMTINPEYATAGHISRLIRFPQAAEIETFYRGRLELVSFRVWEGDFISGCPIVSIKRYIKNIPILFAAVERGDSTYIPNGSFVFEPDDKVYILGEISGVSAFFRALGRVYNKTRNAIIIGGGRTTYYLARELERTKTSCKIIELDIERAKELSTMLDCPVIHGDGTDQVLLESESLASCDVFIGLTDRDEENMMTALHALQLGVPKAIVKNTHQNYASVASKLGIDAIVTPKNIIANYILRFVRGLESSKDSEMLTLYQIADNTAEAMEFSITSRTSFCGKKLRDLKIRPNTLIAAIRRKNNIIIPGGDATIEVGDNIIVLSVGGAVRSLSSIFE